jgi:hypothetical protein
VLPPGEGGSGCPGAGGSGSAPGAAASAGGGDRVAVGFQNSAPVRGGVPSTGGAQPSSPPSARAQSDTVRDRSLVFDILPVDTRELPLAFYLYHGGSASSAGSGGEKIWAPGACSGPLWGYLSLFRAVPGAPLNMTCQEPALRRAGLLLAILLAAGCEDPVRQRAVAQLGPESPGVRVGPLHRPGQPCLLCHDAAAGNGRPFSVAGTLYADDTATRAVNEAAVRITDSAGTVFTTTSNCAGNFYVRASEFSPQFPFWVTVAADAQSVDMESPVYRDGSCASCHTDPKNQSSAGHVFVVSDPDAPALAEKHFCR